MKGFWDESMLWVDGTSRCCGSTAAAQAGELRAGSKSGAVGVARGVVGSAYGPGSRMGDYRGLQQSPIRLSIYSVFAAAHLCAE